MADGYPTVFQLAALLEGGGSLRSISQKGVGSITEDRESKILDVIAIRGSEWAKEWEASQGPPASFVYCNTCQWQKLKGESDPCPDGHATGFSSQEPEAK